MRVSRLFTVLVVSQLLLGSLVACSAEPVASYDSSTPTKKKSKAAADDEDTTTTDDTTADDETTPSPSPSPSGTTTPTTPAGLPNVTAAQVPPAGQCTTGANKSLCVACCMASRLGDAQQGATAANAFGGCACQSPGLCKAECGTTFCAGKEPSAACDSCLQAKALQCENAATAGQGYGLEGMQCLVTCF